MITSSDVKCDKCVCILVGAFLSKGDDFKGRGEADFVRVKLRLDLC